jgi:hypothetical protein
VALWRAPRCCCWPVDSAETCGLLEQIARGKPEAVDRLLAPHRDVNGSTHEGEALVGDTVAACMRKLVDQAMGA